MTNHTPSLARRAWPALALFGTAGTLVYFLDHPAATSAGVDGIDDAASDVVTADGDTFVTQPPTTSAASDTAAGDSDDDATTDDEQATADAAPSSSSSSSSSSTTAKRSTTTEKSTTTEASSACNVHKGPTVDTRWGPVQVVASVAADGTICDVDVLQVPSGGKSTRINNRAVPILNAQVLDIQSADVDVVSGATITSRAYEQSLQAILDKVVG